MTEAGWYEDPEGHGQGRRYWDGSSWTEHYEHPAPAQAQAPAVQQAPAQQLPPAGWKDDPEGGPGMRYWDGAQWTEHYHPPREAAQQPAAGGFAPTGGGFEPAGQAFQPATGGEPAVAPAAQSSSLDETQLDVRGYHAGREEPAAEPAATPEPEPASDPAPATAPEPDRSVDYGTEGDTAFCENCGAKIRSSHKFCPACGHHQEGLPT